MQLPEGGCWGFVIHWRAYKGANHINHCLYDKIWQCFVCVRTCIAPHGIATLQNQSTQSGSQALPYIPMGNCHAPTRHLNWIFISREYPWTLSSHLILFCRVPALTVSPPTDLWSPFSSIKSKIADQEHRIKGIQYTQKVSNIWGCFFKRNMWTISNKGITHNICRELHPSWKMLAFQFSDFSFQSSRLDHCSNSEFSYDISLSSFIRGLGGIKRKIFPTFYIS